MSRKVYWSARAVNDYKNILHYIGETWSSKELVKFISLLTLAIENIKRNPELAAISKKKKIRRFVLSKQTSIYYKIEENIIFIITLGDNRQNPKKLKL